MKKTVRLISFLAGISITLSLLGFYVSRIPDTYNCYPGEDPAGSTFYTLEADAQTCLLYTSFQRRAFFRRSLLDFRHRPADKCALKRVLLKQ